MAKYFVKTATITGGSAPNDANDGLDPIGFGIADGTYNDATKTLTSTGAFTTYVYTAGDQIYIASGTNATPGLYTIASKVDSDNITLTASAGSTDVTADWATSDGPWATIEKPTNTIAAGDTVYVCADGTHTPAANITFHAANSGTQADHVEYTGADARGVVDGTIVSIDGTNCANAIFYDSIDAQSFRYTRFRYFDFYDGPAYCFLATQSQTGVEIVDCVIRNMGSDGVRLHTLAQYFYLERVEIYGCANGVGANGVNRGIIRMVRCSVHDNSGVGVKISSARLNHCLIYDNGGDGIYTWASTGVLPNSVIHCTVQGNAGDGWGGEITTGDLRLIISNNIFSENGGYGINLSGELFDLAGVGPNVFDNNTSGATSIDGLADAGATGLDRNSNVASQELDPAFASIVDGSENLIPEIKSSVFTAGSGGMWRDSEGNSVGGVTYEADRMPYCGAIPPDLASDGTGGGAGFVIGG